VAYFQEPAPPAATVPGASGYLRLSAAYQEFADEAARGGWPTVRGAADHPAPLTRPEWVVDRLAEPFGRLSGGSAGEVEADGQRHPQAVLRRDRVVAVVRPFFAGAPAVQEETV
jgi:hypothetical protein